MASFQSQTTGASSSISQWASVTAINDCRDDVSHALAVLKDRKVFALKQFARVPEFKVFEPQGAFYLWVDVSSWLGRSYQGVRVGDSRDLAAFLLEQEKLAVVPGQEFGLDGFLRLSFAARTKDLEEATARLRRFHGELS
jgi:aspartate aminotransferase